MTDVWMTVEEIARRLRIAGSTVERWIEAGLLPKPVLREGVEQVCLGSRLPPAPSAARGARAAGGPTDGAGPALPGGPPSRPKGQTADRAAPSRPALRVASPGAPSGASASG